MLKPKSQYETFQYEVFRTFALAYSYNKWIYALLLPYLGKNILEVGCGLGNITQYLVQIPECKLTCIDISSFFIEHLKIDYPDVKIFNYDITDYRVINMEKFDTILCINVLEHIKEDKVALKNMYDLLVPNGHLQLFVPSISWLYGNLDKKVGHYRRYNKKEIITKLQSIGFKIKYISYHNFIGVLGWYLNSCLLKRNKFPIIQSLIYDRLVPVLSKIEKLLKPPIGMSLFIVGSK